jgi:hypothetical protein
MAFAGMRRLGYRLCPLHPLLGPDDETFVYLLDGVDPQYYQGMAKAFEDLHNRLVALDKKWTSDAENRTFNYNYFRAVLSVLRTGPGY